MNLARHRLTSARRALHYARHTYEEGDSGPGGCEEAIVIPYRVANVTDNDSHIVSPDFWNNPACSLGQYQSGSNNLLIALGTTNPYIGGPGAGVVQCTRSIISWDLSGIPSNAVIKSARCHIRINSQWGARLMNGDDYVIVPHGVKIYRCKRSINQRYASWCHYDESNEWSSVGCGLWDDLDENDVDVNVFNEFTLEVYPYFPYTLEIYFKELVQDAVSNRSGALETIWIRDNDLDPTPPDNLYLGGENNGITFFSTSADAPHHMPVPTLVINYCTP